MKQIFLNGLALFIAGLVLSTPIKADDLDPAAVMKVFDVKGESLFSAQEIAGFSDVHERNDSNNDGFVTIEEYVSNSNHFRGNPKGAKGSASASDNNKDGKISLAEYVMNRIITDEGKKIFTRIDPTTDKKTIKRAAFINSDVFADKKLAEQIFAAMDKDGNGELRNSEFLIAYGRWARAGLPKELFDGIK